VVIQQIIFERVIMMNLPESIQVYLPSSNVLYFISNRFHHHSL